MIFTPKKIMFGPQVEVPLEGLFYQVSYMTRQEQKEERIRKELEFVESIKGKHIDGKIKDLFRRTLIWINFRKYLKDKRKVDELTGRKLTKTWNCHHKRFDSKLYTDLNEEYFMCLNNQMHDFLHIAISETIKNPDFLDKVKKAVQSHLEINGGKDVRDFKD